MGRSPLIKSKTTRQVLLRIGIVFGLAELIFTAIALNLFPASEVLTFYPKIILLGLALTLITVPLIWLVKRQDDALNLRYADMKSRSWIMPPELNVLKPRGIRIGTLGPRGAILRHLYFLIPLLIIVILALPFFSGEQLSRELNIIFWGVTGGTVLSYIIQSRSVQKRKRIVDYGDAVCGTVDEAIFYSGKNPTTYVYVTYLYHGVKYESEARLSGKKPFPKGCELTLLVNPEDPEDVLIYPEGI